MSMSLESKFPAWSFTRHKVVLSNEGAPGVKPAVKIPAVEVEREQQIDHVLAPKGESITPSILLGDCYEYLQACRD